jgi:tRNA pseudouridine38-40 synthase
MFRSELIVASTAVPPCFVPEPVLPSGRLLVYRVTGDGFLRHMVRAIVGTLMEVGRHAADAESLDALLASGTRAAAGPTAPACGLCLSAVSYDHAEVATQR